MLFTCKSKFHLCFDLAESMTAISSGSSGMPGEYDMDSKGHTYDFATGALSADNINVGVA